MAQEEHHLQMPTACPERTHQDLDDHLQGLVAEWIFNLDGVGISDFEANKTKEVIIPAATLGPTIHHEVPRNVKHISVITCLLAAGELLLLHIVELQNFPVVQEHLKKQGVRFDRAFRLDMQPEALLGSWHLPR
jgi:hypothetical protein